ncbi:MAG TPA: MraY family glycosyltransferase [Candidatus Sulfomarinibacteraceae bacterium]|nr:MraY family glycosyltransferase [Candidatus Sulfomarinibacteraceae bacterium]
MAFILVFTVAFLVSLLVTPLAGRLSMRWDLLARPGGRRRHKGAVPKLGGLPVFGGFIAGGALALAIWLWWLPRESGGFTPEDLQLLKGVALGSLVMFAGGLLDDRWELPPLALFLIQFLAFAVAMNYEVFIERFTNPLTLEEVELLGPLVFLFTLLWIVGMVNTVNFLDGLDGLATGVGAIAAIMFALHGMELEQTLVAAFPLALAGALLGFLPFNFAPARIFLGSAGAYFLGYGLATMSILSPAKIATALLVLAVPIMDVAWQILDRLRRGQSPFRGDRGHLHFRLSDFGLPTRRIVIGYYVVAISFGLIALLAPRPLIKLIMLLLLSAIVMLIMAWLTWRAGRGAGTRSRPAIEDEQGSHSHGG